MPETTGSREDLHPNTNAANPTRVDRLPFLWSGKLSDEGRDGGSAP